ncbi:hypothetical protein M405DRAFT_862529 [Rhizopogon salebrosus TDB-379]|nr:hypothetical protein M405DRAFT_862529 [Rhizopogon salebrosus TDB-379]
MIMQNIINHLPRWSTLACPGLIGNGLPEFLSSSFPVLAAGPLPSFAATNAYVKAFTLPFVESRYIHLSYEVIGAEELEGGCGWTVRLKDWNKGGAVLEESLDAMDITTAWFDNPYFSDIQGLQELQHHQPNKIQHSITRRAHTKAT